MAEKKSFVKDYMTKNVISVSPDTPTEQIITLMKESHHNSYPVVENNKLVGEKYYFDKDACCQDFRSFSLHFYDMQSFSTDKITYTQESGRNYSYLINNL